MAGTQEPAEGGGPLGGLLCGLMTPKMMNLSYV